MSTSTALEALPPSVGDAPVAALLLRDLVADLVASEQAGGVDPAAVEVGDDGRFHLTRATTSRPATDLAHAPLAAPELFDGATPDGRTDVYAATCLALTRYLGSAPVTVTTLGHRPSAATRLGALRHAQRTVPARLGSLPEPFRAVFARAVAKERYLRPTPAVLLAQLDAALAATGGIAAARARVHRLVVLARVFEPGTGSALRVPTAATPAAAAPLHLPIRTLPALRPQGRAARVALIAAVTVVATGGVAVAAVVGLSGSPRPTPQALETAVSASPSTSSSARTSAVATTSSAVPAPATSVAPVEAAPVGGSGGDGGNGGAGTGNGGSATSGRGAGSGGGGSTPRPTRPAAPPTLFTPPPAAPPTSEAPPSETPTSEAPPTDPPTTRPVETGTATVTPTPAATTSTPAAATATSTPTP